MLAIIALFLFTKTDSPGARPAEKRKRDIVYHACGCVNLHDGLLGVRDGVVDRVIRVSARGLVR